MPTRTDVTRMLRALQTGFSQLAAQCNAEIAFEITHKPRQATTGPWKLNVSSGWQLISSASNSDETQEIKQADFRLDLLALSSAHCPLAWAMVAQHLARVDSLINEGYYADALTHLDSPQQASLSGQMRLVQGLRKARVLRRLGNYSQAEQILAALQLELNTGEFDWRMKAYVQSQQELMAARNAFDIRPAAASLNTGFERLRETLDATPNPTMQWEWCNFKALALRRRLDAFAAKPTQDAQSATLAECTALAEQIQALFASAYTWAALAQDMYAAQAVAINLAYNLQMHIQRGWMRASKAETEPDFSPCLAWYALAHGLVDQFSLPQDSAWDFIMLGELVLMHQDVRKLIARDSAAWPESMSPLQIGFYERSIMLAEKFGGMRQKVEASNQMVLFLQLINQDAAGLEKPAVSIVIQRQRIATLRQQMHAWMQVEPESAADMLREGFAMQ